MLKRLIKIYLKKKATSDLCTEPTAGGSAMENYWPENYVTNGEAVVSCCASGLISTFQI